MQMERGELLFTFIVVVSVILAFGCLLARADEGRWKPGPSQYEAATQGQDCAIIRMVEARLKERVDETQKLLTFETSTLQKRRNELELCGKTKGVGPKDGDGNAEENLLAELCPDAYESWLAPSYRFHMLSQDLEDAKESLSHAKNHLREGCAPLPKKSLAPLLGQISKVN